MSACRSLIAAIALLTAAVGGAAAQQPALDCTEAKTPADQAICGNPELSKADADMSAAYSALSKNLPTEQKAGLLANQRQWLKDRNNICAAKSDALAGCLMTETRKRRAFLVGEGDNGPAGAPPLLPAFYDEAKKGAYEITAAYPQFASTTGARFNLAVRELAIAKDTLAQYRQDKPNEFNGSSNVYQVTYDITYLAPRLAAVTFEIADYQGGAHPNSARTAVLWDPSTDKPIELSDILSDPKAAVPAISAGCKDKLAVAAKKEGWDFFDKPDFAAVVGDIKSWSVGADGVTIMFDPYSIAAYVVGPRDCQLTYAELKDWLKPNGALPPSR